MPTTETIRPEDVIVGLLAEVRQKTGSERLSLAVRFILAENICSSELIPDHKIRACDCMLKAVFLYCKENGVELCGRKIESAADFLHFTDVGILAEAERTNDKNVGEMLGNIVNRRLFKRALVISMNGFERPGSEEDDPAANEKYNLVHELIGTTLDEQRTLAVEIWGAAGKPGRKEEVWLDFPKGVKSKDLATTFVNVGNMEAPIFRTLEKFIPIEQWTKQYLLQKWRGHVFCKPEYVPKISPAASAVLGGKYDIEFNEYATTPCDLGTT